MLRNIQTKELGHDASLHCLYAHLNGCWLIVSIGCLPLLNYQKCSKSCDSSDDATEFLLAVIFDEVVVWVLFPSMSIC